MDVLSIISWLCIVTTIGFFVSGIPIFIDIIKSGSTGEVPYLPFLLGLINSITCLWYGVLKDDFTMLVVNTVGTVLYIFYVTVFVLYADDKEISRRQTVLGAAFLAGVYIYFNHVVMEQEVVEDQLGLTTCVLVFAANISPLAELGTAIRKRSSESFSTVMALSLLVTSIAWTFYGVLIKDLYVQIPSAPGIISGITQLALLSIFPSQSQTPRAKSD